VNQGVYIHQRIAILMGQRGAMVEMIRARWAPYLERKYGVRLFGVWATAGSTGEWPEVRVQWELDDWEHFARACDGQHPMEERDTYLTELWNQALDFRRGGSSMLLRPTVSSPDATNVEADGIRGEVVLCEHVRSRPGRMAAYHDALTSEFAPLAEAYGVRLLGAYEHVIVPNTGLNLWVIPGWDEWRDFMKGTRSDADLRAWNRGLGEWLADLDGFLIVPPPTEALRT
jgi:hypothetical protein